MASRVWTFLLCAVISSLVSICAADEYVVTLEHSNFSETVSKSDFIVVEFYAPWCGHCKNLAPEYEKAASTLSSHDPPITLAKVDATVEANQELISTFQIRGFPTLKILRNGGKGIQEYKGPREADGIVAYLKKQLGPATTEIKSAEDAASFVDEKKIFIVGIFPEFSGEEYLNYTILAEKLRSDYDFAHTLDAKLLPRGESVKKPTFRLFKPFDELLVDSQDFDLNALEKFIEDASVPILTVFTNDPNSHPFVMKYFNSPNAKAMLFVNFSSENLDAFKSKLHGVASLYKGEGILFLLGDLEAGKGAFEHFGLQNEQAPLIIAVSADNHQKYLKPNLQPDDIAPWVEDYINGKVAPFTRSEPIPEVNNEPVKVVVADSIQDIVFKSGKNVLVEFYAPWCGHCKQLAPILDEVAVSFEKDDNVIIAKMDATKNDVPSDTFQVEGYPTLYFKSAGGKLVSYEGARTKEAIIEFINKNRDGNVVEEEKEKEKENENEEESVKDEL